MTERHSRNADFISIARRAIHNPRAVGPSNLRTFRTFGALGPVNLHALKGRVQGGTRRHLFLFQLVPSRSSLFHGNRFSPVNFSKVVPPCPILFRRLFHLIFQSSSRKTGQWNKWNKNIPIEMYKRKEGCKWHMYDIYIRARGACSMGRCC